MLAVPSALMERGDGAWRWSVAKEHPAKADEAARWQWVQAWAFTSWARLRATMIEISTGRDDWIRTSDPHTPSVMRYQTALRPGSVEARSLERRGRAGKAVCVYNHQSIAAFDCERLAMLLVAPTYPMGHGEGIGQAAAWYGLIQSHLCN